MAKQVDVNVDCTTYYASQAFYNMKVLLDTLCGWTVVDSGSGTAGAYGSGTDLISSVGVMDTARAWYVIRDANSKIWLSVQRTTSNNTFRIKLHITNPTGGTPDKEIVPSSTDEKVLLGGGSDAAPTGASPFTGAAGAPRAHIISYDANQNAAGIRPVYLLFTQGTSTLLGAFCIEAFADGTYSASNAHPWAAGISTGNDLFSVSADKWVWYYSPTSAWAAVSRIAQPYTDRYLAGSVGMGVDPWDSKDQGVPSFLGRGSAQSTPGLAGFLANIRLRGVIRTYPDTTTASGVTSVYAGDALVPYADGTTPL
jgi:hypothetical protein